MIVEGLGGDWCAQEGDVYRTQDRKSLLQIDKKLRTILDTRTKNITNFDKNQKEWNDHQLEECVKELDRYKCQVADLGVPFKTVVDIIISRTQPTPDKVTKAKKSHSPELRNKRWVKYSNLHGERCEQIWYFSKNKLFLSLIVVTAKQSITVYYHFGSYEIKQQEIQLTYKDSTKNKAQAQQLLDKPNLRVSTWLPEQHNLQISKFLQEYHSDGREFTVNW